MLDEMQARRGIPKLALANGYLLEAADVAEKLQVVLGYVRDIVGKQVNPAGLIGRNLADTVEQFAAEMVAKIRAAADAKEGK